MNEMFCPCPQFTYSLIAVYVFFSDRLAGVPISDLPEMPPFISWGYVPNSGHSPIELEATDTVGQSRQRTSSGRAARTKLGKSILCLLFMLVVVIEPLRARSAVAPD